MHGKNPALFFSEEEQEEIRRAIAWSEKNTSGEIRVHLVHHFKKGVDPLEAGRKIFEDMEMTHTAQRNGVLFLLELKHRYFVILGDKGIDEKVPSHFWEEIRDKVVEHFKKEEFSQGLAEGIKMAGEKLKEFFPIQAGDMNELPDELSYS